MATQQTADKMRGMQRLAREHRPPLSPGRRAWEWVAPSRVRLCVRIFLAVLLIQLIAGGEPRGRASLRDPWTDLGLGLVAGGLALRSWAAGVLRKDRVLATTGPYQLCRHPLYVGSLLAALGCCLLAFDVRFALLDLGPFLAIHFFRAREEERRLAARFGAAWKEYLRRFPRRFPVRFTARLGSDWSVRAWLHNREYQAVAVNSVALLGLFVWRIGLLRLSGQPW